MAQLGLRNFFNLDVSEQSGSGDSNSDIRKARALREVTYAT